MHSVIAIKRFYLSAVVMVALMPAARAQNVMFNTLGYGEEPCSIWTTERSKGPNPNSTAAEQWVLGFLVGREDGLDVLISRNNTSTDSILSWIDHYCKNHNQALSSAADAYGQEFDKTHPSNN